MSSLQKLSYKIFPSNQLSGSISPPASKSTSIRAVLAASISDGVSEIRNCANNFNTNAMVESCRLMGADIQSNESGYNIQGVSYDNINEGITLNPQNSGVVLRLLAGVIAGKRDIIIKTDFLDSLGSRANIEILNCLQELGAKIEYRDSEGRLPIIMRGGKLQGGSISVSGQRSSQFLSGLLYTGAIIDQDLEISVSDELKSKPMINTTIKILKQGGVNVKANSDMTQYFVPGSEIIKPAQYTVGSDPASTSALLAVAAMVNSDVILNNYYEEEMGDGIVLRTLQKMGVTIQVKNTSVHIKGGNDLVACDFDGSQAPDSVLPLAALACYAKGTSRFYNIEHIRYKECDRISDFREELLKVGADVEETQTELIVHGKPQGLEGGVSIDSHFDHGVIMAITAVALRSNQEICINDAQYVGQTYPNFFDDIKRIGASVITHQPAEVA